MLPGMHMKFPFLFRGVWAPSDGVLADSAVLQRSGSARSGPAIVQLFTLIKYFYLRLADK